MKVMVISEVSVDPLLYHTPVNFKCSIGTDLIGPGSLCLSFHFHSLILTFLAPSSSTVFRFVCVLFFRHSSESLLRLLTHESGMSEVCVPQGARSVSRGHQSVIWKSRVSTPKRSTLLSVHVEIHAGRKMYNEAIGHMRW